MSVETLIKTSVNKHLGILNSELDLFSKNVAVHLEKRFLDGIKKNNLIYLGDRVVYETALIDLLSSASKSTFMDINQMQKQIKEIRERVLYLFGSGKYPNLYKLVDKYLSMGEDNIDNLATNKICKPVLAYFNDKYSNYDFTFKWRGYDEFSPQEMLTNPNFNKKFIFTVTIKFDDLETTKPTYTDNPTDIAELKCTICNHNKKSSALGCGHVFCGGCTSKLKDCPMCRVPISRVTHVFL